MLPTTIVEFNISNNTCRPILPEDASFDFDNNEIIYWIHLNLNNTVLLNTLQNKLHLPENLIHLFTENKIIPNLIEKNDSMVLQIECVLLNEVAYQEIVFGDLFFYLNSKYCLTASNTTIPALKSFDESYAKYVKYAETPCFILFLILDNIVNDFSKMLLDFELKADQIDLEIRETTKNTYTNVMSTKKQVMKLQHHVASIRDILMRISGRKISVISEPCRLSLNNLLDHTKIIFSEAEAIRENLRNTLDQIDNALMQRMNETMKVLTAFAAIFLPLTLITGIYGMNFDWIPELHWKYGYFWSLGLMILLGLFLLYIFKKKKWF